MSELSMPKKLQNILKYYKYFQQVTNQHGLNNTAGKTHSLHGPVWTNNYMSLCEIKPSTTHPYLYVISTQRGGIALVIVVLYMKGAEFLAKLYVHPLKSPILPGRELGDWRGKEDRKEVG